VTVPRGSQGLRWDATDLRRRLCHALEIAGKAVERLAEHGYSDAEEPANKVPREKIICETAILLYAAATAGRHADTDAAIAAVARALIPHARSKRMLLGICLEPSLALDYAEAHICLSRLGYPDPGFDQVLRQARAAQAGFARERVPHRVLEQRWIGGLWTDMPPGLPGPASSTPVSVLNQPLDVLNGSREHVYAFTHALMYIRDFNIKPRRLPRSRAVMLAEAEAALARCLDEDDYDLAGEVLMAWPLTGPSWSAAAAFGFRVLAKVEDETGHLPAPSTRQARLDRLEGTERTDYWLATAYHTIYVMGLLCAAALQPARAPPVTLPRRAVKPGGAEAILHFLDADGRSPRWRRELDRMPSPEPSALAGFLFNVALIRKVQRRDFGAAHELLRTGYALGLADGPASSQSAEMLERLATFEQITGSAGADLDWQPSTAR
jgi:hypothetical protein